MGYQIGTNADYDATEKRIVAWSGNDLYILNRNGRLIYNNKMSDTVQFASVGDEYVAVFVGDADNGVVSVINGSGQIVVTSPFPIRRCWISDFSWLPPPPTRSRLS
ncbi:MAG: hypothetical protein ACLS7Z_11330 [Christensenellales bacterium]